VHNFSEMISANVFAGFSNTDFTTRSDLNFVFAGSLVTSNQVEETDSRGSIFEVGFDAKWIELKASRNVESNSLGGLDQKDILFAKLRMQASPLIGLVLTMSRTDIEELNASVIGSSRIKTVIAPAINFTLARNLKLKAEYMRVQQDYASEPDADSNTFFLNMKYDFPSI